MLKNSILRKMDLGSHWLSETYLLSLVRVNLHTLVSFVRGRVISYFCKDRATSIDRSLLPSPPLPVERTIKSNIMHDAYDA